MTNDREVIYYILVEGSVRLFARVDGDEAASLRALLLQPMATHELRRRVAGMRVCTQIVTSSPSPDVIVCKCPKRRASARFWQGGEKARTMHRPRQWPCTLPLGRHIAATHSGGNMHCCIVVCV